MNQDIPNSIVEDATEAAEGLKADRGKSDQYERAIDILERGPNTLEEIYSIRKSVFSDYDVWRRFGKYVNEQLDENEGEFEKKHGIGLAIQGQYDRASEELEKLETTPVVGCLLTRIYLETDREDKALELIKQVHERVPEVLDYHVLLCQVLDACGDYDDFRRELEHLEARYPEHAETLYLKGLATEREGEYEEAKRLYLEVLEKDSNHAGAQFRLGYRYDLEQDDEKAIEFYSRAATGNVPNVAALTNLGLLYEDNEEYDKAVRCYALVNEVYPQKLRARLYLQDAQASLEMYYDEEKERKEDKQSQILKIPVSDFELSVRSRNCLAKMNIQSLGDLIKRTEAELLAFKNFGETSLMEIKEILSTKGLRLGMMSSDSDEILTIPDLESPPDVDEKLLQKSIDELDLSVRSKSCLQALKIATLGQLVSTSEQTLMTQKNFGQTSLNEIRKKLAEFSLSLKV